jgi:dihydrofolate synthase/folylpolyglutamate synthase
VKSYRDALTYLYGLQGRGVKFGLRNIEALLQSVGDPHRRFPSIHIAGTNGKGSTAAFLASAFMAAGYRTGLYTSPHLVRFTERIRVDGKEIPADAIAQYAAQLIPASERYKATFFEVTTCIAMQHFAIRKVDIAIIETGLGGRLDATNVLHPMVSVITEISIDHTRELGTTIAAIAREKAGIMKRGVPCVTGASDLQAIGVMRRMAREKGVQLFRSHELAHLAMGNSIDGHAVVNLKADHLMMGHIRLGFAGVHQAPNAQLAAATLELLLRQPALHSRFNALSSKVVAEGFREVQRNSRLHGRLEVFGRRRRYVLDVAHNVSGIQTLLRSLGGLPVRPTVAVFGVMKDKPYTVMLDNLSRAVKTIVLVAPSTERAEDPKVLFRVCRRRGIDAPLSSSVGAGLAKAEALAGPSGHILITGSHYVVGEAFEALGRKGLDKA